MPTGYVVILKNNYGFIQTDEYKVEDEWIPFQVDSSMLIEKDGKQFIKYTDEVDFILKQEQGIRDRDIKVATNVKFTGSKWKYKQRDIVCNFIDKVKKRLDEYNFYYPDVDDGIFIKWLSKNNFQPRMLEYLSPGIFTAREIIKSEISESIDIDGTDAKFKIDLLFVIDRIDVEFRKKILAWVTGIENAYKTYFVWIDRTKDGKDIGSEVINAWASKKNKVSKLVKRARNKQLFRETSDDFDYLLNNNATPLFDFMEQLELNELAELVNMFYNIYHEKGEIPKILEKMKECVGFIHDLSALRNAAAHGRSILPLFMDPNYNGNWDLEFDNVEKRTSVDKWILYDLLKTKWERNGLGEYSSEILNTIYGNPVRRAWMELNYIYFYIVQDIEKMSFKLFFYEADWFLSKEADIYEQLKHVNILNLRLSDMGCTTLNISPPPYDEIANEAYSVWELFNK